MTTGGLAPWTLAERLGIPEDELAERFDSAVREGRLDALPETMQAAAEAALQAAEATTDPAVAREFQQLARDLMSRTAEMREGLDEARE